MTTLRAGNYLTFLQIGRHTYQDKLKLIKNNSGLNIERIRRQATGSIFKRFIKYERNYLTFSYMDENQKQIGGRLKVLTNEWNFSQLASHTYAQYGYFTDDKLVFAKFDTDEDLSQEEAKFGDIIKPSISSSSIIIRHNFELVNNIFQYRMEINPNLIEKFHEEIATANEDQTIEGELVPRLPLSNTERFFLQLGKNH